MLAFVKSIPLSGSNGILPRSFEQLDTVPELVIEDGGEPVVYRQDFAEHPGRNRNLGQAEGKVHLLALGDMLNSGTWFGGYYKALEDLDFSDEILLLLSGSDLAYLNDVPWGGALVNGCGGSRFAGA